jgi:hypothetical protein
MMASVQIVNPDGKMTSAGDFVEQLCLIRGKKMGENSDVNDWRSHLPAVVGSSFQSVQVFSR